MFVDSPSAWANRTLEIFANVRVSNRAGLSAKPDAVFLGR